MVSESSTQELVRFRHRLLHVFVTDVFKVSIIKVGVALKIALVLVYQVTSLCESRLHWEQLIAGCRSVRPLAQVARVGCLGQVQVQSLLLIGRRVVQDRTQQVVVLHHGVCLGSSRHFSIFACCGLRLSIPQLAVGKAKPAQLVTHVLSVLQLPTSAPGLLSFLSLWRVSRHRHLDFVLTALCQ